MHYNKKLLNLFLLAGIIIFMTDCNKSYASDPYDPGHESTPPVVITSGTGSASLGLVFGPPSVVDNSESWLLELSYIHVFYSFDNRPYTIVYGDEVSASSRKVSNSVYRVDAQIPLRTEVARISIDYQCRIIRTLTNGLVLTNGYSMFGYKLPVNQLQQDSTFLWYYPDTNSVFTNF